MPEPQVADPTHVADVAAAILAYVKSVFEEAEVALPERQYRTSGGIAFDGEQCVVMFDGITAGAPGRVANGPQDCVIERFATYLVGVVRCVPVSDDQGDPPTMEALDASAVELLTDAWVLQRAAEGLPTAGIVLDGYAVAVTGLEALEPSGGLGGQAVTVQVALP